RTGHESLWGRGEDIHVVVGSLVEVLVSGDGGGAPGDVHREPLHRLLYQSDGRTCVEFVDEGHAVSWNVSSNSGVSASVSRSTRASPSAGVSYSARKSSMASRRSLRSLLRLRARSEE